MILLRFRVRHALGPLLALAGLLSAAVPAMAQFPDAPREALPPLEERRAAVLKEFDRNSDGRLDTTERETARQAWSRKQLSQRGDRGFFQPPPELLEEFDKNKDGELDDQEGRVLGETLGPRMEKMRKDYDKNANGRLDPDEVAAAEKDVDAGKLKGIPRMFIQFAAGPQGGPRGPRGPRGPGGPGGPGGPRPPGDDEPAEPADILREADANHDGRLDAREREAVRAAWAKRRAAAPAPAKPGNGTP